MVCKHNWRILFPSPHDQNWDREQWGSLPQISQLVSDGTSICPEGWLQRHALNHSPQQRIELEIAVQVESTMCPGHDGSTKKGGLAWLRFKFWLQPLLNVRPGAKKLLPFSFSFSVSKMGSIISSTWDYLRMKGDNYIKHPTQHWEGYIVHSGLMMFSSLSRMLFKLGNGGG